MWIKEIADRVREIPLPLVVEGLGLPSTREGSALRVKTTELNLFVQETKFFDNKSNKGGGGAIDLVAHVRNCSPREAILWLDGSFGKSGVIQPALLKTAPPPKKSKAVPFSQQIEEFASQSKELWPRVKAYLTGKRQIPSDLVDMFHDSGRIFANDKGGAYSFIPIRKGQHADARSVHLIISHLSGSASGTKKMLGLRSGISRTVKRHS